MMINKIFFSRSIVFLENQYLIKVSTIFQPTNERSIYKTLGTSEISSPMSPPCLDYCQLLLFNIYRPYIFLCFNMRGGGYWSSNSEHVIIFLFNVASPKAFFLYQPLKKGLIKIKTTCYLLII